MIDAVRRTLFEELWEYGPNGITLMLNGLKVTLVVTLFAVLLGVVLGTVIALMRMSRKRVFNLIARAYTELIRGTPFWSSS